MFIEYHSEVLLDMIRYYFFIELFYKYIRLAT